MFCIKKSRISNIIARKEVRDEEKETFWRKILALLIQPLIGPLQIFKVKRFFIHIIRMVRITGRVKAKINAKDQLILAKGIILIPIEILNNRLNRFNLMIPT